MNLPFVPESSPAAGFRPRCKVGPPVAAAGAGGLLDMAMSLLAAPQADPWADHLSAVELVLAPAPAISHARLTLVDRDGAPAVAAGDTLRVELGEEGALSPLLQGEVLAVDGLPGSQRTVLLASAAVALARQRHNTSHRARSLADLLAGFAAEAGLTPGALEGTGTYPFLALDDRRSLWEWAGLLAAQAGLRVWVDGTGALRCAAPGAAAVQTFRYGHDVLMLEHHAGSAPPGALAVVGEGAAGSQGAAAWSWLTKDPQGVRGQAGTGAARRVFGDGTLRTAAAARDAAQAYRQRAQARATRLRLQVPGSPQLVPGAAVRLQGSPGGVGDGRWVIERAVHRYRPTGYLAWLDTVAA